jgi:hypothetical protein
MSKELDTMGRAAQVHLRELQLCKDKNKSYNNRRREATDRLRPMLTKIWAALEAGETVNGCTGKEMWARWYNHAARGANGIRQIQRIINPPEKKKVAKRHDVASDGAFLSRIADAKKKLADIQSQIDADFKPGETRYLNGIIAQISPIVDSVFEEFLALVAPDGYEVMKASRGWMVQEKWTEVQTKEAEIAEKSKTPEKMTAAATKSAISALIYGNKDDWSLTWAEAYDKTFTAAVKPEWHATQVRKERERIDFILRDRGQAAKVKKQTNGKSQIAHTVRTQSVGGFYAYLDPKKEQKGHKPWVLVHEGAQKAALGLANTREEAELLVDQQAQKIAILQAEEHPAVTVTLAAAVDAAAAEKCEHTGTTWWSVDHAHYQGEITALAVERETAEWLILADGERQKKETSYLRCFPSKEEAKNYAREILTGSIKDESEELRGLQATLEEINDSSDGTKETQ